MLSSDELQSTRVHLPVDKLVPEIERAANAALAKRDAARVSAETEHLASLYLELASARASTAKHLNGQD